MLESAKGNQDQKHRPYQASCNTQKGPGKSERSARNMVVAMTCGTGLRLSQAGFIISLRDHYKLKRILYGARHTGEIVGHGFIARVAWTKPSITVHCHCIWSA